MKKKDNNGIIMAGSKYHTDALYIFRFFTMGREKYHSERTILWHIRKAYVYPIRCLEFSCNDDGNSEATPRFGVYNHTARLLPNDLDTGRRLEATE